MRTRGNAPDPEGLRSKYVWRSVPGHRYGDVEARCAVTCYETELALKFMTHFGVIAGKVGDREDSAGRNVLENMAPEEVVERACQLAECAVAAFEERGWIKPYDPPVEEDDEPAKE